VRVYTECDTVTDTDVEEYEYAGGGLALYDGGGKFMLLFSQSVFLDLYFVTNSECRSHFLLQIYNLMSLLQKFFCISISNTIE